LNADAHITESNFVNVVTVKWLNCWL